MQTSQCVDFPWEIYFSCAISRPIPNKGAITTLYIPSTIYGPCASTKNKGKRFGEGQRVWSTWVQEGGIIVCEEKRWFLNKIARIFGRLNFKVT